MATYKNAIVIGAGAFGTSIASIISHNFENVYLKVRNQELFDALKQGENSIYLPGVRLPKNITPVMSWGEINKLDNVQLIVSGLPSKALTSYFKENRETIINYLNQDIPLVSLSKGIDPDTLELPDDIFYDIFYEHKESFLFLSGPSFAKEIVEKQITLATVAGRSRDYLERVTKMMQTDYFKLFPSYDIKGVLLGGALKNIIAIAGGMAEGFGYNHNTRAALITVGIQEMLRFGKVFAARAETFYGLSGMGDLILTTTGELSRNKQFGLELAKGRKAEEILAESKSTVEGYKTTQAVHFLAEKYKIRARVFNGMYRILYQNEDPQTIVAELMSAPVNFDD